MTPCVLTVAGSDSGGGAGIQADLKTFAALGVHGLSAITAVTAQSTVEVRAIHAVPAEMVRAQIEVLLDDFDFEIVKTGMLLSSATIRTVASLIEERGLRAIVDPVMVSESGTPLLEPGAIETLKEELLPSAALFTPNLLEVEALLGMRPETEEQMEQAGRALLARGPGAVLVKGGHRAGPPIDVLVTSGGERLVLAGDRIDSRSTHGTGCTYASAIAAFVARGESLERAVQSAHAFVRAAIAAVPRVPSLGRGRGPLHHFHRFYPW